MRRGMFNLMLFLMMASTITNLYTIHRQLIHRELDNQARLADASEVFYQARNAELDFFTSATSPSQIEAWHARWGSRATFGYLSPAGDSCIQVEETFPQFLKIIFWFENQSTHMEAYGNRSSCIFLPFSKGGFKTSAVIVSPACIKPSSWPPLSDFC